MKPGFLLAAVAAWCCLGGPALAAHSASGAISSVPAAAAGAASVPAAVPASVPPASAAVTDRAAPAAAATAPITAPAPSATPEQQAALAGARPTAPDNPLPMASSSATGSLVQTVFALGLVLALLVGLAWLLKRYGPKSIGGSGTVRLVGALSVGARERILVVEVGEQWIVVGASPGRMNALATMPRQDSGEHAIITPQQNALPSANFAEWFKQTIEKRNGK